MPLLLAHSSSVGEEAPMTPDALKLRIAMLLEQWHATPFPSVEVFRALATAQEDLRKAKMAQA